MPIRLPIPRHPLSIAGALLTTIGAVLFLVFFFLELLGLQTNPYMGIVFFLILPSLFVLGLILIPIGAWLERRRKRAGRPVRAPWPRLDLNDSRQRTFVFSFVAVTIINVVIVSLAAYSGVEYMDSVSFCGQVCHTVMRPEFVAYENGPHARVACVQCHIGPGAPWFVRSKLSGTRQVFAVTFDTYSRPIPSPVENLRPAQETCEQCHWPDKFQGDIVRVIHDYATDEANTDSVTTLAVHVGGGVNGVGMPTGIHWHVNAGIRIEYIATDDKRQVIPWVRLIDRDGNVTDFVTDGVTADQLARGELRTMDCVDCHNRPSHTFDPTADRAVNRAMASGAIPSGLPFVKREATAALTATYPSQTAALDAIAAKLREFYRLQYPQVYSGQRQDVEHAVSGTQELYRINVFPSMNVTWGTYPNNIGHMDFPGCFRCHDDSHKDRTGQTIPQNCDLCHSFQ